MTGEGKREDRSAAVIGARLSALRTALGYGNKQGAFARILGVTHQAWNNYESGRRRLALDQALLVKDLTGVTLDWIYCGDTSGIPLALAERISKALELREIQNLRELRA